MARKVVMRSTTRQTAHRCRCNMFALVCLLLLILGCQLVLMHIGATLLATSTTIEDALPTARRRTFVVPETIDGTFNNAPLVLHTKPAGELQSHVWCAGETYQPEEAWKHRSCRFDLLCYNTSNYDFVVFTQPSELEFGQLMAQREHLHVSSSLFRHNDPNSVSLGGINQKWGHKGIPRLKWFPKIEIFNHPKETIRFYMLPNTTVLLPFHSLNGANPGHLVWDDYLPMFTLLQMFDLVDYDLLPIRFVLQDGERGLWASCDLREEKTQACQHMMTKFHALIAGIHNPYNFTSTIDSVFTEVTPAQSELVCAQTGLAGMGPLTDHGLHKAHGWEPSDYKTVHNHGRGGSLYAFRNFMIQNLQIQERGIVRPYRIVFSQKSSEIFIRSMDFERQIAIVKEHFPEASVENYILRELTLQEQVELASQTAIFITLCGGGAVTGMFLPKGASVILYYAEDGGTFNGKMNHKPALLDWDLYNAISYLRVHWMPRNTRKSEIDEQALIQLITHELDLIESRAFA